MTLAGKTLFITGASRGIGLAIALRAARDGANIAIAAKTAEPHPRLQGTIYSAADEIERAGGKALPLVVDVRDEAVVRDALDKTAQKFGGIDIVVNNASAIQLTSVVDTDMKRFDLMHQINARGTFVVSKWAIPHLAKAANPHILMISPPLDMKEKWFAPHTAYSIAKFDQKPARRRRADAPGAHAGHHGGRGSCDFRKPVARVDRALSDRRQFSRRARRRQFRPLSRRPARASGARLLSAGRHPAATRRSNR
jgi:NADPH:quinone reductase-like Zn-dependent oxidoreductase